MTEETTTNVEEVTKVEEATQTTAIAHFDVTEAALAELKKFQTLKINGVDDKDGYENVRVALRNCVTIRNKVVKRRQDLKRQIDDSAKYILDTLAPIEKHLDAEKATIDGEKERIKQEKKAAELLQFNNRTAKLFELGFQFNGNIYTLGRTMLDINSIREYNEDQWLGFLANAEKAAEEIAKAKAAEEARLQKEKDDLAAEKAALAAEKAELAKLRAQLNPTVVAPEPPVVPARGVEVKVTEEVKRPVSIAPVVTAPVIEQPTTVEANVEHHEPIAHNGTTVTIHDYANGFNACRKAVLDILASPDKFTRAQLVERINTLKP